MEMAKCPKCGWKLPPLMPKKRGKLVCPDCSSVLVVESNSMLVRTLAFLFMVPLIVLARLDDQNSLIYALIAIVVFPLLLVFELVTDRLRFAEENEF
jgi:DNA-directed RNA polymerase subunit RPC12/RpoP